MGEVWVEALTLSPPAATVAALACEERAAGAFLGQPSNTVTSFAFVLAGLAVLAGWPRTAAGAGLRWPYGLLVAAVGAGSVIQHGPHPSWQAYAHDLTLAGVLAFVAADHLSDLTGRRLAVWWWLVPTAAVAPLVALGHTASSLGQVALAVVAIGAGLLRAWLRPELRSTLLWALGLLAVGALVGTLGERTALCQPESLWQGHAAWHLLAAAALWRLAPAVGARRVPVSAATPAGPPTTSR